jgi:hypothetical protein
MRPRLTHLLIAPVLIAVALPTAAQARRPIISYVDNGSKLQLYDAETGKDVTNPPPIPAGFLRLSLSLDGRYVVFTDAAKKLHLLDRAGNQQAQLPGIDVYVNPGNLTVSNTGLIGFDDNSNGPTVVYDSATKAFVDTGLAAINGHRQPKLSGDGKFLATTCGPAAGCIVDQGSDSNQYVQNLATKQDTGFPDGNDKDEEHPCITNDGSLVGFDRTNPAQRDVFLYDRNLGQFVSLPALSDPAKNETHCILSPGGNYIGFLFDNIQIKVFERSTNSYLSLPSDREFDTNSTFSAPYPPEDATKPSPPAAQGTVTDFSMQNRRFRVGSDPTPTVARKGKARRAPRGSAFRYGVSSATTVRIAIARQQRGRKSGRKCRKATRKLRKHKKCTRSVLMGTLSRNAAAGAGTTAFSGRINSRALKPGRYLATISAGNQKQTGFTIVSR